MNVKTVPSEFVSKLIIPLWSFIILATIAKPRPPFDDFLDETNGSKIFFSKSTIDYFNQCYYCKKGNRRGLGFDKPQIDDSSPTCGCVPMSSFGHSGFTGTYAWADPDNQIVYVFLSNRTYPSMNNNKLSKNNIRTEIQRIIYNSLK